MNAAVKVQSMASAKANTAERLTSLERSAKSGDFTKMLQVKKDLADNTGQTEQTGQAQTEKSEDEPVKKLPGEKENESEAPVKGEEDAGQQEALQQAVIQQAAAQVAGFLTEDAETAEPEPVLAEAVSMEAVSEEMPAVEAEPKTESVRQEAAPVMVQKAPQSEAWKESEEPEAVALQVQKPAAGEQKAEVRPDTQGQDKREDLGNADQRQTQDTSGERGQELYGAAAFRVSGQTEHLFQGAGRTSEIPLKTTPQTLPEDLGKTLAARLPDTGRTLTVELEPASLGKLTIRMTYEAGRAAVSIMATNPKTLELLNEKAAEIASILEEKTGQSTVILTQQPHEQEQYQENKDGTARQGEQEKESRREDKKEQHTDSFAQQLRLGLI